ncbi:MAG: choice-of-anchor D domain-containing protein [candidate division KSB1 bacterium]|nr:choice-of-anchor D domain-containing protein [candidate division KSB1 bacterium]MDZ7305029.1 choice-of-anchor D domain-containing protein [candidate division KSB1 bacterium]MDZ7314127.1 choice-of-anchor D domain-containing protein [candidate division KSB1 bacterium]
MIFQRKISRAGSFGLYGLILVSLAGHAASGSVPLVREENRGAFPKVSPDFLALKCEQPACSVRTVWDIIFDRELLEISTRVYKDRPKSDTVQFKICNRGKDTLRLVEIIPRPYIELRYDTTKSIEPDSCILVQLIFRPIKPDTICGCLYIIIENLSLKPAQTDTAQLPYHAIARAPRIQVNKRLIDFGDVAINKEKIDTLVICNNGDTTLNITSYDTVSLSEAFQLLSPKPDRIEPTRCDILQISFKPSMPSPYSRTFWIHCDSYEDTLLAITLHGRGFTGPGIEFNPDSISFRTCLETTQKKMVNLRNIGTEPLTVWRIDSPDPIALPSPITDSIIIKPDSFVVLSFNFIPQDTKNLIGRYIALSNRKGGDSTLFVTARANTASFRVAPTKELLEPLVAVVGEKDSAAFFIDNASDCSLFIDTIYVKQNMSPFDVSERKVTIKPRGQIPVWVRFAPNDTLPRMAKVFVRARYFATPESLIVQGKGLPGAIFVLDSGQLNFGEVCIGSDSTRKVRVRNAGHKTMVIRDIIRTGSPAFTIHPQDSIRIGPGGEHIFAVTYTPTIADTERATFEFITSSASGNKKLYVQGRGIRAELEADCRELIFKEVALGDSSTLPCKLTNKSNRPIRIFDIEVVPDNGIFSVFPKEGELNSRGDFLLVKVTYKPVVAGKDSARLVVEHNANCADTIFLSGTGVPVIRPTIENITDICLQDIGKDIKISARFNDDCMSNNRILHFRAGGSAIFDSLLMAVSANCSTSSATIPGAIVGSTGIEYYFTTVNEKGVSGRAPAAPLVYAVSVRLPDGIRSHPLAHGDEVNVYRMISIPLILDDPDPLRVLKNSSLGDPDQEKWRLFDYQNGSLHELTAGNPEKVRPFQPGRAYWLITKEPGKSLWSGSGSTTPAGPVACADSNSYNKYLRFTLEPGWNMIANPFKFPIPKSWLHIVDDSTVIYDRIFSYDRCWKIAPDTLQPWLGYAIKLGRKAQVAFNLQSVPRNRTPGPMQGDQPESWTVQIIAHTGQYEDAINYLGVRNGARNEWDGYDLFDPPSIGACVNVAFPHLDWIHNPDNYTGDFRTPFADGAIWEFEVKSAFPAASTTLEFVNLQSVPGQFEIYLHDKNRGLLKDLRNQSHYTYEELGELLPGRFELIIGSAAYTQPRTTAIQNATHEFQLYANYPNPFNNETIFSFSLPNLTQVWLKIFDLTGREVTVLSNGATWEKGRNYVRWDGSDRRGNKLGSGIYILSFQAGEFKKQQRITLVK